MPKFVVEKIAYEDGRHLLHEENVCPTPPDYNQVEHLGTFASCKEALVAAKKIYPTANGCIYCCNDCHTA